MLLLLFFRRWRGLSDRAGAGMFNVVVVLFTAVSPSYCGLARSGRPPLCALRGTARQPLSLPPGAPARLLPAARDHRTRAAMSIEKWRALVRQIPKRSLRAIVIRFRAVKSPVPGCEPAATVGRNGPVAPRSLARS